LIFLNRWLRLVPSILVVIGAYWLVAPSIDNGPLWNDSSNVAQGCSDYWWAELSFLVSWKLVNGSPKWGSCIGVTWYLTCDFFYFACTPFVLLAYKVNKWLALSVLFLLVVLGSWGQISVSSQNNEHVQLFANMAGSMAGQQSQIGWSKAYFSPWLRANPYIVGVLLGLLYDKISSRDQAHGDRFSISPWLSFVLQFLGGAICLFIIFIPVVDIAPVNMRDGKNIKFGFSQSAADAYNGLARLFFAIGLSLIATSLIWGRKQVGSGFLSWLLSAPLMAPLGKLSFHAYLWHLLFVHWYYGQQVAPVYYTWFNMLVWWLGFIYIAFTMALITHLTVEVPFGFLAQKIIDLLERTLKDVLKATPKGHSQEHLDEEEHRCSKEASLLDHCAQDAIEEQHNAKLSSADSPSPRDAN